MLCCVLFVLILVVNINSTVCSGIERYDEMFEDSESQYDEYDAYIYPNKTNEYAILREQQSASVKLLSLTNDTITVEHVNGSIMYINYQNLTFITMKDEKATFVKLIHVKRNIVSVKHDNGSVISFDQTKYDNLLTISENGRLIIKLPFPYNCEHCRPEQVHIAYGDKSNTIVITWQTFNETLKSVVKFGTSSLEFNETGSSTKFRSPNHTFDRYIHTVRLTNLKRGAVYKYHCGSDYGWSDIFEFRVPNKNQGLVAFVYGDMGNRNPHALSYIQTQMLTTRSDVTIHLGDFAYNLQSREGKVGDQFMRQIQSIAAKVPYMTCPGNHEKHDNYLHYRSRFVMPNSELYYSFNVGFVHFISMNTELYFNKYHKMDDVVQQYNWLVKDLVKAAKKRYKRPWIVLFGHRPMYCSNVNGPLRCKYNNPLRVGIEKSNKGVGCYGIEPLLKTYGVDVVFWGHQHSYERLWPIYDYKVYRDNNSNPYMNPSAPVHITSGSAGCWEKINPFAETPPEWSAIRSEEYGYMIINVPNRTHMNLVQYSVDRKNTPIDDIWIVKTEFKHHLRGFDV